MFLGGEEKEEEVFFLGVFFVFLFGMFFWVRRGVFGERFFFVGGCFGEGEEKVTVRRRIL